MDTPQNELKPSPLFLKNVVKYEGDMSTLPTIPVKRTSSWLSNGEVTTSNSKRIKQGNDDPSCYRNDEHLFIQSETSLRNIVSDVVESLKNNRCEGILSLQGKSSFESAAITESAQADTILVLDDIETGVNEVTTRNENTQDQPLPSPSHSRRGEVSVLSEPAQIHIEPRKPMLRKIQSLDTGTTNGFAFDHTFYPKVVGVQSISSRCSTLTSAQNKSHSSQKSVSPAPLEELDQGKQIDHPVNMHKVDTNTNTVSYTNPVFVNSPTSSPTQKQYDLLFTFKQKDGQNDMFLVINDKVFSVRRCDHKGESFLIHTDSNGKSSILAKLPQKANMTSQINDTGTACSGLFSNMESETTNALSRLSEQPEQRFHQRMALHSSTKAPVTINPVQRRFVQTLNADTRIPGEPLSSNSNPRQVPGKIPGLLQCNGKRTLLNDNKIYSEHEAVNSSIRMPNDVFILARQQLSDALILGRQQLSNQLNNARTEKLEHMELQSSAVLPQKARVGKQYLDPQTHTIRNPRHHLIANDTLQTSAVTALHMNAFPARKTANGSSSQQPVLYQNVMAAYQRNDEMDARNEQSHTNTTAQKSNGRDQRNGGYPAHEDERRIQYRHMLLNYIANKLASSEEPSPPAANSVSANRRSNDSNTMQNFNGAIPEESVRTVPQTSTHVHMVPHPQCQNTNDSHGWRNSDSRLERNLETRNSGQRHSVNEMARQNIGSLDSQHRYNAPLHNNNLEETELLEDDGVDATKQILQVIDSWQRRFCSNNDSPQIKELLVGTTASGVALQTAVTATSSRKVATESSQAVKNSNIASTTPFISQVLYGVINRSTGGENVVPKRTATALVIDPNCSIYVDATDSVIDEERRQGLTGQRISKKGITNPGLHSNQPENVTISFPVSSAPNGIVWSQEYGPKRCMNLTAVQRPLSRDLFAARPSSDVLNIVSQSDQRGTLLASDSQRSHTTKSLRRQTPMFDKRCVAKNTLKEVSRVNNPPRKGRAAPTSLQRSCINVAPTNNTTTDEVVEIIIDSATEPALQPNSMGYSEKPEKDLVISSQQSGSDAVLSQTSMPQTTKPCDDDDDVVEIIMPVLQRNSPSNMLVNNVTLIGGQDSSINETSAKKTINTETEKDIETGHLSPEHNFQPKRIVSVEEKQDDKLILNPQNSTDQKRPESAIKAATDDGIVVLTPTDTLQQDYQSNTVLTLAKETGRCDQRSGNCVVPSTDTTNAQTSGENDLTIIKPSAERYAGPDKTKYYERGKVLLELAAQYEREAVLKTVQQREELVKKIRTTRERIAQEKIDWKKKYLYRLEIQLKKRLAKIAGGTELREVDQ